MIQHLQAGRWRELGSGGKIYVGDWLFIIFLSYPFPVSRYTDRCVKFSLILKLREPGAGSSAGKIF